MAHLTNDNHKVAFSETKNHLGGISKGGNHLVVIKQNTSWSNKKFVVPPCDVMSIKAASKGVERYPNVQGGANVMNDTNNLINSAASYINNGIWQNQYAPIYNMFFRYCGPYSDYDENWKVPAGTSEYDTSIVAYKFNLHRLHFSKMSSFKAYVRVFNPSKLVTGVNIGITHAIQFSGGAYNDASKLCFKLVDELPERPSFNMANGYDKVETNGHANAGTSVTRDTDTTNVSYYQPLGVYEAPNYNKNCTMTAVYAERDNLAQEIKLKTYYWDYQLQNTNNLNVLKKNPAEVWLICHYYGGNAFAASGTYQGLQPGLNCTCYSEKVELVLECTSTRFV